MTDHSLATMIESARRSVEATRHAYEAALAHLREIEACAEAPARPMPPALATDRAEPEWTNLARAAIYCSVTEETMGQRAAKFGLGRKVGRAWSIDMVRVRAHLENRPYDPIAKA